MLRSLQELGFNELEGEVYLYLLPNPPATAYAVGKAIGRPTANVYKAVEALSRRGAVMVEEGESRVCRAVPVAEFLRQAKAGFEQLSARAAKQLGGLQAAPPDEGVYRIESVGQVFERARTMLEVTAETISVIDAFPTALAALRPSIEKAIARRLEVLVEAYTPIKIKGAKISYAKVANDAPAYWGAEQLNLVIDGREHLLALLNKDCTQLHQAVWSRSLYLSCLHHSGRLCEQTLLQLMAAAEGGADGKALKAILNRHRFFMKGNVPGQKELSMRFAQGQAAEGTS